MIKSLGTLILHTARSLSESHNNLACWFFGEMNIESLGSGQVSRWDLRVWLGSDSVAKSIRLPGWAFVFALLGLAIVRFYRPARSKRSPSNPSTPRPQAKAELVQISPAQDFDLNSINPPVFRPFKPKYHLTMGEHLIAVEAANGQSFLSNEIRNRGRRQQRFDLI